jgi:hypothetical protein
MQKKNMDPIVAQIKSPNILITWRKHKDNKMWKKNMNITKCKWKMQRCKKKKKGAQA